MPEGRTAISSKWAFKHKRNEVGEITRFKARVVARGFSQIHGLDYWDTFAPVAKLSSLRILLAIAAVEDLEIHQMDVITAFLISKLEEEIYMEQPEGFVKKGVNGKQLVCRLWKSLYGLKQASRVWNRCIHNYLISIGFKRTYADHCVYINHETGIILALWVDDLIIMGKKMEAVENIKNKLRKEFEMKDMGELKYFLGIHVQRNREERTIHISQKAYITKVLKHFGMQNCKPASTPMAVGTKLLMTTENDDNKVDPREYQSKVGSEMYAMVCTRPDTAYGVSFASHRFHYEPPHRPLLSIWTSI